MVFTTRHFTLLCSVVFIYPVQNIFLKELLQRLQYRNILKTSVFFGIKNIFNGFYNVKAFLIILVEEIS